MRYGIAAETDQQRDHGHRERRAAQTGDSGGGDEAERQEQRAEDRVRVKDDAAVLVGEIEGWGESDPKRPIEHRGRNDRRDERRAPIGRIDLASEQQTPE